MNMHNNVVSKVHVGSARVLHVVNTYTMIF